MSSNSIFRKSSMERVTSPEQLNDYIKVTRPSVWLLLGAVIALLIGVCVWGVFGKLTTSREALLLVRDGKAVCYVKPELSNSLASGMELRVGESTGELISLASTPMEITEDFDAYALYLSDLQVGDWVLPVAVDIALEDGVYMAKIVLETISPISFVLN